MMTQILDGKKIADEIALKLKAEVAELKRAPLLKAIVVGNVTESAIYVRNKMRRAAEIGIAVDAINEPEDITEAALIQLINKLNADDKVDGIMVQLPLPTSISEHAVINAIAPEKDVDGFSLSNVGRLWTGNKDYLAPATPVGIMTLLDYYHLDVSGKNSVIIGRSNIVGKPLAALLLAKNSTVTIAHSRTENLKRLTQQADFLFVAIGQPQFVKADFIKKGVVIVDVGINRIETGLVGDVDFADVDGRASFVTPVPRGVGPMTVISLMIQIVKIAKARQA